MKWGVYFIPRVSRNGFMSVLNIEGAVPVPERVDIITSTDTGDSEEFRWGGIVVWYLDSSLGTD